MVCLMKAKFVYFYLDWVDVKTRFVGYVNNNHSNNKTFLLKTGEMARKQEKAQSVLWFHETKSPITV